MKKNFYSDNVSGASPEILQAIVDSNADDTAPYGADQYTQRLERRMATAVLWSNASCASDGPDSRPQSTRMSVSSEASCAGRAPSSRHAVIVCSSDGGDASTSTPGASCWQCSQMSSGSSWRRAAAARLTNPGSGFSPNCAASVPPAGSSSTTSRRSCSGHAAASAIGRRRDRTRTHRAQRDDSHQDPAAGRRTMLAWSCTGQQAQPRSHPRLRPATTRPRNRRSRSLASTPRTTPRQARRAPRALELEGPAEAPLVSTTRT